MENSMLDFFANLFTQYRKDKKVIYLDEIQKICKEKTLTLNINFSDIVNFNIEFARLIINNPTEAIESAVSVFKEIMRQYNSNFVNSTPRFFVRFYNLIPYCRIPLRKIRQIHINRLIEIKGVVSSITRLKRLAIRAVFSCSNCGGYTTIDQVGIEFNKPVNCNACDGRDTEDRRVKLRFTLDTNQTEYIDFQEIKIQESPQSLAGGLLPTPILCYLKGDIVGIVKPGDTVKVTGVLNSFQEKGTSIFEYYLEINHIKKLEIEVDDIIITQKDKEQILELAKKEDIYEKLINSIAPNIYGLQEIKEGILHALFGGVFYRHVDPKERRGEIHVLIIGDPGQGKSALLKQIMFNVPKAIFATGSGSSGVGLTVSIIREGNKTPEMRAGALVLADKGLVIIDEFEKMDNDDMRVIHESMEQLTTTINKWGFNMSLNTRTTILANANPVFGRYNRNITVAENIKNLSPTILSRFDLIYIIIDRPNDTGDLELADFILTKKRIIQEVIEPELLKKYIYYSRKNCQPQMTPEANAVIKDFFINLRSLSYITNDIHANDLPIAITPRYLEALIRLSEAHAKIFLRDKVLKEDAKKSIEILSKSLKQIGFDMDTGMIDIDRIETGHSLSFTKKLEKVYNIIKSYISETGELISYNQIIAEIVENEIPIDKDDVRIVLEQLKEKVMIIEIEHDKFNKLPVG